MKKKHAKKPEPNILGPRISLHHTSRLSATTLVPDQPQPYNAVSTVHVEALKALLHRENPSAAAVAGLGQSFFSALNVSRNSRALPKAEGGH